MWDIMKKADKHILWAALIVFVVFSMIPIGGVGCLHHSRIDCGIPPWLGVDVQYGHPDLEYIGRHGPITRIRGIKIYWSMLPFSLGASLVIGAFFAIIAQWVMKAACWVLETMKRGKSNKRIVDERWL